MGFVSMMVRTRKFDSGGRILRGSEVRSIVIEDDVSGVYDPVVVGRIHESPALATMREAYKHQSFSSIRKFRTN